MNLATLPWVFQFNMQNDAGQTVERSVAFHEGRTYWRYDNQVTGKVKYYRGADSKHGERVDFDQFVEIDVNGAEVPPETQRSTHR